MCVSSSPARFTSTILYAGEHKHPSGKVVHVLGYQNTVENIHYGPNAMLLPIPSAVEMGEDNMLDTTKTPKVLGDLRTAVSATWDTLKQGFGGPACAGGVERAKVFDKGRYTIVLAKDARAIKAALSRVPENRRPTVKHELTVAYAYWYPGWHVALCCFDAREMSPADPILWWYEPKDPNRLFYPGLDAHDGNRPNLKRLVDVDHTLIAGCTTERNAKEWDSLRAGKAVFEDEIPSEMAPFLPDRVIGMDSTREMMNGDWYMEIANLRDAKTAFMREPPPKHDALF